LDQNDQNNENTENDVNYGNKRNENRHVKPSKKLVPAKLTSASTSHELLFF
jgi:hypothetical protein